MHAGEQQCLAELDLEFDELSVNKNCADTVVADMLVMANIAMRYLNFILEPLFMPL